MSAIDVKDIIHLLNDLHKDSPPMLKQVTIEDTHNRFGDADREPCTALTPIEGFQDKPLVTLEEAVAPLTEIIPRVSAYVLLAKQRAVNPANGLTIDESAAIVLYTMEWRPYTESLYYIVSNTLRTENRQLLKPWFLYLKLLLTGLSLLPSATITVYRGIRNEIPDKNEKYQVGKENIWWGFSSCSLKRNVAERKNQFLDENMEKTLFVIDCVRGKDISEHSYFRNEQEVLLLPATTVKVVNHKYLANGLHEIYLKEIESSYSFLQDPSTPAEREALRARIAASKVQPLVPKVSGNHHTPSESYFNPRLSEYIARCKDRSEIFLIGKPFNENDIEMIADQLINEKKCKQLFLRESGVTAQGATAIAKRLYGNKTLERLFISHNTVGDEGTKALAEALQNNNNTTLTQLCLGNNGITDEGLQYLTTMLQTNRTITHLWLHINEITDYGLQQLVDVIVNMNKTIQLLALEWNRFHQDSSIYVLINMINKSTSLKELSLNSCRFSRSALRRLRKAANAKKGFTLTIH